MPVGQHLEQVGLEWLVGAVELVDQQDRRLRAAVVERLEQRPLDEELPGKDAAFQLIARRLAARLGEPYFHHLPLVVPLVDGAGHIETFVALQPHQIALQRPRHHLRDLGLPHAGLALEKQRALHPEREEEGGGEAALGDVVVLAQQRERLVYRTG